MCHYRMFASKPKGYHDQCDASGIWNIDIDGGNVEEAVQSIAQVLKDTVLPWLDRYTNREQVLERFLSLDPPDETYEVFMGYPFSRSRATVVCGILISRGEIEAARSYLSDGLASDRLPESEKVLSEIWKKFNEKYPKALGDSATRSTRTPG